MKLLKSNNLKFIFKLTISIVLLFLIFRFIGIDKVYRELLNANPNYILIAAFFIIFEIFFKALRWKTIIKIFNKSISVAVSMKYTLISIAFGFVTPGRLGEFIKAKYLVESTKISYLKSIMTVIIDKIFDFIALILLGLLGFSFLGELIKPDYFIFAFFFYILILILVFIFFNKVLKLIDLILPTKYKIDFKNFNIDRAVYIKSLLLSFLIWVVLSIQAFFIIKSLGISSIPLYAIMGVVPLMALSSVIPISIGGLGVREVIAMSFFIPLGIPIEKSAMFSLIYTFIGMGISAIIGAILYVNKKRHQA